jgi:hypothetical protein
MSYQDELIALQNDIFRRSLSVISENKVTGLVNGLSVASPAIQKLTLPEKVDINQQLWEYNNFNVQNDPRGWHEQGRFFSFHQLRYVDWTIDYYDENYRTIIDNPLQSNTCKRVMTIMLGSKLIP